MRELSRHNNDNSSARFLERHFSVRTLAEILNLSEDTIVRMFSDVPGVFRLGEPNARTCAKRTTLRIPESVVQQVYQEHVKK
jgi:hypothetical protein